MTPQQSYPPSCMFLHGMNSCGYMSSICIQYYNFASSITTYGDTMSYLTQSIALVIRFIRHSFHCFEKWLHCCAFHLFHFRHQPKNKLMQLSIILHILSPPGEPPWYQFTNYLKTKNRPFINPSRGRSVRQGGRTGDKHRRYKTCQ